jgi:hyperosmotically inducible protein
VGHEANGPGTLEGTFLSAAFPGHHRSFRPGEPSAGSSVFDNLEYKVDGPTVTLYGQVVNGALKDEAEAAVKHFEGVEKVVNHIEILPPSPWDDRIRHEEFRAIYSFAPLQIYAVQAVPPIHILVKNGHVTLAGMVDSEADKNAAYP